MKLAFSTLGCPEWSWGDIVATAKDLGYDGIELRGIEHQMFLPKASPLVEEQLQNTKSQLKQLGLKISCLTSSCDLNDKTGTKMQEGEEYIDLAAKLEVPFIRVLGDSTPEPGGTPFHRQQVKEGLQTLGKIARAKGITVLIETNGQLADSGLLADLVSEVNDPGLGVLWDIHHPYRFFNESPATTITKLGKAIKYIHIKDSKIENGKIRYCMLGEGDLPIREALETLTKIGYNGWISLEWVKKWNPNIEEPGIAFPSFITTMKRFLKEVAG